MIGQNQYALSHATPMIATSLLLLLVAPPASAQQARPSIAEIQAEIDALKANSVLALDGYLVLDETDPARPAALFTGANVQVVNGLGSTATANGTGNLIVGYDETRLTDGSDGDRQCSLGTDPNTFTPVTDEGECITAGGVFAYNHKTGSHYVVAGTKANYSRWGGIVAGDRNTSNFDYATVTGGSSNVASAFRSSVTGGSSNRAGELNASVSGGLSNVASGLYSSVSGGRSNQASGRQSSISGGADGTVSGNDDWLAGSLFEDN